MTNNLEQLYRYRQELADAADRIAKYMVKVEMAIQIAEQADPANRTAWMQAVSTKESLEA
jgi:hypothetical protein